MIIKNYKQTHFIISIPRMCYLPSDIGIEVAFTGHSNVGKSSALNTLTGQKGLARVSKTPGRTQTINLFEVVKGKRIIDLPGYGYSQVSKKRKTKWKYEIDEYLKKRHSLNGLVVMMDIRHPLKHVDEQIINLAIINDIPVFVLLSKSDKLTDSACKIQVNIIRQILQSINKNIQVTSFSSLKRQGITELQQKLNDWFNK